MKAIALSSLALFANASGLQQKLRIAPGPTASVSNLKLAGAGVVVGERALFGVYEPWQGVDLNGDGDLDDTILHVRELATGETWSPGLSTPFALSGGSVSASERLVIAPVEESPVDLNGDGDRSDFVLHVGDLVSRRITNVHLDTAQALLDGETVAFLVREYFQGGKDLNGDGDALDEVVHVYGPSQGALDLRLVVPSRFDSVPRFLMHGGLLAFIVGEPEQGGLDLNGDGDALDNVLHVREAATGTVRNLGLSLGEGPFASLFFAVGESLVVFTVAEVAQGVDLNGDGDLTDRVAHVYRSGSGTVRNLALATHFNEPVAAGDAFAAVLVSEAQQGNANLNGDPDRFDVVPFVYDSRSDTIRNVGLASRSLLPRVFTARGRRLAYQVDEGAQRANLNGDGDQFDTVLHVYDVDGSTLTNLHLATADAVLGDDRIVFRVSEANQANQDLTGDGDVNDRVLFVHDLRSSITRSSGAAADEGYGLGRDVCLFEVDEFFQGDVNGDGDTGDRILRVFGCDSAGVLDLGLARGWANPPSTSLSARGYAFFGVDEEDQQSSDLNGDGDSRDIVVHAARLADLMRAR